MKGASHPFPCGCVDFVIHLTIMRPTQRSFVHVPLPTCTNDRWVWGENAHLTLVPLVPPIFLYFHFFSFR
jgi:hypothetical protein